ncbi:MAG: transglutaminase domain-containing protein, partial [Deltaproteobacteria bacterium]|nr:transglutaminase domain-containing protein [Deltaproteobacteria bacterium]
RTESERHERLPRPTAQTELLLARVHRRDGTVLAPEQQDAAAPSVRWPRLRRGDVVEVAVRAWTTGPVGRRGDVPFYFVDYVGSLDTRPVLYNEVVVDAPEGSPLAFEVVGGAAERRSDEALGERRITHLVWERPPTVRDEPLAPALTELVPVVVGSAFPDWRAFLRWYREAVAGFTQPDDQIRRLGADLTRGKNSREEKIEALFNFVADDIRYVNYVSGEWWLPNRPQQLLARRQGDCDDKAMLLISLLRAVGIEATEVLLQTRHTAQPAVLQTTKVAVPLFDHGIVALRAPDGSPERYLDATSPQSRLGPLPAMDLGARALLVPDGEELEGAPPRILVTPPGSAADHGVEARWTIRLEPSGAGTLDATQTHRGDGGFVLRSQLGQADARAQWVEQNLVADWFPSIKVSPKVSFRGDLPGGAAEVGYRARSESLARREGEDLVLVLAPTMPLVAELAPLVGRTLPVVLPPALAPQHQDLQLRLEAPKTHDFAAAPPDSVEDGGAFGAAELSFVLSRQRDVLTVSRRLSLQQSRIEVAEYTRWRAWLQRIDRLTQRSIRLVPRAAAGL